MKSIDQILKENNLTIDECPSADLYANVCSAIIQAQEAAIDECANKARLKTEIFENEAWYGIDKQSILKLKEQIK